MAAGEDPSLNCRSADRQGLSIRTRTLTAFWMPARQRMACVLWLVCAAACTDPGAGHVPVRVGIANASSDVGLFIAHKKGYFKAEGLNVSFVPFDSGARMVAPLGAG